MGELVLIIRGHGGASTHAYLWFSGTPLECFQCPGTWTVTNISRKVKTSPTDSDLTVMRFRVTSPLKHWKSIKEHGMRVGR